MKHSDIPKAVLSQSTDFTDSKTRPQRWCKMRFKRLSSHKTVTALTARLKMEMVPNNIPKTFLSKNSDFTDSKTRPQRSCKMKFQRLSSHKTVTSLTARLDHRDGAR